MPWFEGRSTDLTVSDMPRSSVEDDYDTRPQRIEMRREVDSSSSSLPSPNPRARRKSLGGRAKTILGLGGTSAVLENDYRDRDKSRGGLRRRDRSSGSSRSSSQDRRRGGKDTRKQLVQSAKSALLAGAGEAFRSRKEAEGPKRKRVLTAAVSAGAINALLNNDKKDGQGGGKIQVAESVVGGLAVNYLVHGSRHKNRSPSRGRRDGNGTNGAGRDARSQTETVIATASMNGSKSRDGSRRYSSSDFDSVGEEKKRGKSMGDLARAGMAKLRLRGDKSGDDTISSRT